MFGKKYEKIKKQKFSIFSFLFGSYYWIYRKIIIESIILFIIENLFLLLDAYIVSKFQTNIVFGVIIVLILSVALGVGKGFLFPSIYKKFVSRNVEKITSENSFGTQDIIDKCIKKGGVSVLLIIIFVFISGVILGNISNLFNENSYEDFENNNEDIIIDFENNDEDTSTDLENNDEDISTDFGNLCREPIFNIEYYIEIEIPEEFEEDKKDQNSISYKLEEDATFILKIYDQYDDATEYIEKIIDDNNIEDSRYDVDLEGISWNILAVQLDDGIYYYNIAKLSDDKTLLYEYFINLEAEDAETANQYYQDIIYSIKPVDHSLEIANDDFEIALSSLSMEFLNDWSNDSEVNIEDYYTYDKINELCIDVYVCDENKEKLTGDQTIFDDDESVVIYITDDKYIYECEVELNGIKANLVNIDIVE